MLVRLMYASRAVAAFDHEELHSILRQSRRNNPTLGVTGVLCWSQGLFLQVLEGGRSAVNRLYIRIAADPRHGQVDMAHLNPALVLKFSETGMLDPYAISGAASLTLFGELVATASVICSP